MRDPALERASRDPYGWRGEQYRRLRELSGDPRCNPGRCRVCGAVVEVSHSSRVDPPLLPSGAQFVITCGSEYCKVTRPLEGPLRCAGPVYLGDQGIEGCLACSRAGLGDCTCCDLWHIDHTFAIAGCVFGRDKTDGCLLVDARDPHDCRRSRAALLPYLDPECDEARQARAEAGQ